MKLHPVHTYVAFLRAINLGAKRKFPKDAIVASTGAAGFAEVATHINTGNVRFTTAMRSRGRVEAALEAAYLADRGFEVPTIVFTAAQVDELTGFGDELAAAFGEHERHAVLLLKEDLDPERRHQIETTTDGHRVAVHGRAVHVVSRTLERGQVDPLRVGDRVGVATMRNQAVLRAIRDKWC